jgi:hypothetical protein
MAGVVKVAMATANANRPGVENCAKGMPSMVPLPVARPTSSRKMSGSATVKNAVTGVRQNCRLPQRN